MRSFVEARMVLERMRKRSQSEKTRTDIMWIEKKVGLMEAFVKAFDEWQEKGDGVADSEGGFDDVTNARNSLGD